MPPDRAAFVPPPYPHDRLGQVRARAAEVAGGMIDASVGTPVDPMPQVVLDALTAAAPAGTGYPATIGSTEYPAPKGKLKIRAVAVNPVYTYTDNLDFAKLKKGEKVIKVAPGPNNPVGVVWLDLTKQGYGIHGTPDPAKVGKNYSHGCIRLTNWDARELAGLVDKGTPVVFSG